MHMSCHVHLALYLLKEWVEFLHWEVEDRLASPYLVPLHGPLSIIDCPRVDGDHKILGNIGLDVIDGVGLSTTYLGE